MGTTIVARRTGCSQGRWGRADDAGIARLRGRRAAGAGRSDRHGPNNANRWAVARVRCGARDTLHRRPRSTVCLEAADRPESSKGNAALFDDLQQDDLFSVTDALEALRELEQNTSQAIIAARSSERVDIRTPVVIRPGNSSDRHRFRLEGMTADISDGGMMVLTTRPILPGDVYWVTFTDPSIALDSLFARCLRCRLVQEGAFESGFRFLQPIDLRTILGESAHSAD